METMTQTKIPNGKSAWQFIAGILMADAGLFLFGLGDWDALHEETRILVYGGGVLSLLSGFLMIWLDTIRLSEKRERSAFTANENYFGRFKLVARSCY
jgi:hypothetical protein